MLNGMQLGTRLKVLWWDKNGLCLLYKRLHGAVFELPRSEDGRAASVRIDGAALGRLLAGVARPERATKVIGRSKLN